MSHSRIQSPKNLSLSDPLSCSAIPPPRVPADEHFDSTLSLTRIPLCPCRARAVLSDEKRRALYDAGMYDPLDDDQEDVEVSCTHHPPNPHGSSP